MALYTKIEQSLTFYNTTGYIEKHKNIYYVPVFTGEGITNNMEIREAYKILFDRAVQTFTDYVDIMVSGWSPEDRTMKVKGNIEDFRTVTSQGKALNYFIIKRRCYQGQDYEDYYYAFFVTDVSQVGLGTVELAYEPDHFTNVFYLQNKDKLTTFNRSYNPFNRVMKNTHVVRQHINRIKLETLVRRISFTVTCNTESTSPPYWYRGTISGYKEPDDWEVVFPTGINPVVFYDTENDEVVIEYQRDTNVGEELISIDIDFLYDRPVLDNMEKFINTEERYNYRYDKRVEHEPITLLGNPQASNVTQEEQELIDNTNNFLSLPTELQHKIISSCISYLKVISKDNITRRVAQFDIVQPTLDLQFIERQYRGYMDTNSTLKTPFGYFLIPFIKVPLQFNKYKNYINLNCHIYIEEVFRLAVPTAISSTGYKDYTKLIDIKDHAERFLSCLANKGYGDYVQSVQVVSYASIQNTEVVINSNSVTFKLNMFDRKIKGHSEDAHEEGINSVLPKGLNLAFLSRKPEDFLNQQSVTSFVALVLDSDNPDTLNILNWDDTEVEGEPNEIIMGLIPSAPSYLDKRLLLNEEIPTLTDNYYEPILECEPYTYFTISYLAGYETPLSKIRYYETPYYYLENDKTKINYFVKINYVDSNNDTTKISFIPVYSDVRYYNEAITVTLSNNLPIVSDSYYSYYWQNQAQMKNQFAVNNFQRGTDLAQTFFNTAPAQVGAGFISTGQAGGFSQLIKQVSGMIDMGVDWAQSNKVTEMTQKAKMCDMGNRPDTLKQTGSDVLYDLQTQETQLYVNKYTIDKVSYNTIAKYLERFGYHLNLYMEIDAMSRVGWNFVEVDHFDYEANITVPQEEAIRKIFGEGVTLLHNAEVMTSGHNYETIVEGGEY